MNILVTGGGGYIGSFMVKALVDRGENVSVVDNFERGYEDAVDKKAKIIKGDLLDKSFVISAIESDKFDAIIHFAGLISVAESMREPGMYFESNIMGALNIMDSIKESGIKFIFSSTAAVYGNPLQVPIPETHPKNPTSPYGVSKLMVEDIINWYNQIYGFSSVALRYFNASGAALDGSMGERHKSESHIIPLAIKAILNDEEFRIYGTDYDTTDGTCERDYIHVLDLVKAHMLALDKMKLGSSVSYNVGTGIGYSNKQVVEMIEKVSNKKIKLIEDKRRPGDPDKLIADPQMIKADLGFNPEYSSLEAIVDSAYKWHSKT